MFPKSIKLTTLKLSTNYGKIGFIKNKILNILQVDTSLYVSILAGAVFDLPQAAQKGAA